MTTKQQRPRKRQTPIGNGFKATVIAFSLMSMVIAWDLVARREEAKALSEVTPASPLPLKSWPTPAPWPTLAPAPALPPVPTLPPLSLTVKGSKDDGLGTSSVAATAVSVAPPPSLPTMPALAPLPEMPAPPPPPPPSGGGGGGKSRSGGS